MSVPEDPVGKIVLVRRLRVGIGNPGVVFGRPI
jgi:hypothetical protein